MRFGSAAPVRQQPGSNGDYDHGSLGVLDIETGAVERLRVPGPDMLRFARCSPWRDRLGRTQVVAQWWGACRNEDAPEPPPITRGSRR